MQVGETELDSSSSKVGIHGMRSRIADPADQDALSGRASVKPGGTTGIYVLSQQKLGQDFLLQKVLPKIHYP